MQFTDQKVHQQPWGVIVEYIAIELTTGAILAPIDANRVNSNHGPLGANSRGANWVWCELTPPVSQEIVKGLYNLANAARQPDLSIDNKRLTKENERLHELIATIQQTLNDAY